MIWAPLLRSTIAAEQVPAPATSNRGVLLACLMSVIMQVIMQVNASCTDAKLVLCASACAEY